MDLTGLTIAHVAGDPYPELVVGNPFGDVLFLKWNPLARAYQPPSSITQNVSLAVIKGAGA